MSKKIGIFFPIIFLVLFIIISGVLIVYRHSNGSAPSIEARSLPASAVIINGKLNINSASVQVLSYLPGISINAAERIVAYREKYGPFESRRQLLEVTGIGESTLEGIWDYITIGD